MSNRRPPATESGGTSVIAVTALILSLAFGVPYIFTLTGFAGLAFMGHVVTIDDDLRGGWSNPEGKRSFPWVELLFKAAIFLGLCWAIAEFPGLKAFGRVA